MGVYITDIVGGGRGGGVGREDGRGVRSLAIIFLLLLLLLWFARTHRKEDQKRQLVHR